MARPTYDSSVDDLALSAVRGPYDVILSCRTNTIDGHLQLTFEEYVTWIWHWLREEEVLLFGSHDVFGPGRGGPGDDGDLEQKFEIVEKWFRIARLHMIRAFVPKNDVDKLFIVLRRRPSYDAAAVRTLDLASARHQYID